jgi:hypothetical protein
LAIPLCFAFLVIRVILEAIRYLRNFSK